MNQKSIIIFVCEHAAAKSIVAAAHFNQLAKERGLDLHAVARGTNPEEELSPEAIQGLSKDGLRPTESIPLKLTQQDLQAVQRIISFCELPVAYEQQAIVEYWDNIPPVSENYAKARDAILHRIHQLLDHERDIH